tara:strand:- start:1899 stop:2933 length:1035 start_codon:yes stop_codon:yes gene_type:complete
MANTVASTPTTETAPEDLTGDTHVHFDVGYKAAFAEIASLFEDIQSDVRVITDRFDNETKGVYTRKADTVAPNPANIAAQAAMMANLEDSNIIDQVNAEIAYPADFSNTSPTNYNAMRNSGNGGGGSFVGGSSVNRQGPGYAGAPTTTNASGQTITTNQATLADIVPASGNATGNVRYGNQNGKRNLPIQQQLMDILQAAATSAGVDVLINSGGQVPKSEGGVDGRNRTGSNRHDRGYAADVSLFVPDFNSTRLSSDIPEQLAIMVKFMEACRDAGATGIGQGNGYMNNRNVHVDIAWIGQKNGQINGILSNRYWGGGGSDSNTNTANTPTYLAQLMESRDNIA